MGIGWGKKGLEIEMREVGGSAGGGTPRERSGRLGQ